MHPGAVQPAPASPAPPGGPRPSMSRSRPEAEARTWGRLPNVYRHAVTMEELRLGSAAFEALPPVEQLLLAGPASHRYVRQDDPLWSRLHAGVLTTSLVRGALGLYEKAAAKRLGIPNSRTGHGELVRAYHHLRLQAEQAAAQCGSPGAAAEAAAAAHNAAAVAAFNAPKASAAAAAAAEAAGRQRDGMQAPASAAPAAPAAGQSKGAQRRERKKQARLDAEAARAVGADSGAASGPAAAAAGWGVSEEQKQRTARALGSAGLLAVSCSWGSVQEASALLHLAAAFPRSQLAEVGLCRLQPHLLPQAWGFEPGSLPPIGASPDALMRHTLQPASGQGAGAAVAGAGAQPASSSSGNVWAAAPAAAAAGPRGECAPSSQAGGAVGPWDIDGLLARLQLAGSDPAVPGSVDGSGGTSGDSGASNGSSGSGGAAAAAGHLIEVVEVKHTSPFGHNRRGGKLRTSEYAVADRGPRQEVPPEWVPQLQLHMLCTGTPSGLLVSRSATRGTRVFRLRRDDELLRLMLLVLSRLWRQHVLVGRPPAPDVYASWREHHDLLRRIVEVARGAQLVASIEREVHPPGSDARWFLD